MKFTPVPKGTQEGRLQNREREVGESEKPFYRK